MSETSEQILKVAQEQAQARHLKYFGDVTPQQAWRLLQEMHGAVLLDVRTEAEWELVGSVPNALEICWKVYPDWELNPHFLAEVQAKVRPDQLVLTLCRSGVRSVDAAVALTQAGYARVLNILEGFEGDKNDDAQRVLNGWKRAGLPWYQ